MPETIVVMPTYNECENLPAMAETLFALNLPDFHLLVVDDNSPDGTGKLAEDLSAQYDNRIHVLHRKEKNGLGPAYLAGFERALAMGATYIIQMDADFSHQPKYIPDMLALAKTHDVVPGSRFMKGGGVDENWSLLRKLLSLWANRIYTPAILQIPIYDATGGFRVWKASTLRGMNFKERIQSNGYVFQVEMIYVAHRLGYTFKEFPIYFPDRAHGDSKMSSGVALEAALRVWKIRAQHHHLTPDMRESDQSVALSST